MTRFDYEQELRDLLARKKKAEKVVKTNHRMRKYHEMKAEIASRAILVALEEIVDLAGKIRMIEKRIQKGETGSGTHAKAVRRSDVAPVDGGKQSGRA